MLKSLICAAVVFAATAAVARMNVFCIAGRISPMTGRRDCMEIPKSPTRMRLSQMKYCTGRGWSKAYSAASCRRISGEALSGRTALNGSPGAR